MGHAADRKDAFDWVDDYLAHVRPHFEVRVEDRLLIVMPNKAVKLNATGLAILRFLKEGGSIQQALEGIRQARFTGSASPPPPVGRRRSDGPGGDALLCDEEARQRRRDLFHFLCDFRSLMTGCLGEGAGRRAVEVVSHAAGPFNSLPVLSEIALTYRCNLQCRFCYAGCGCHTGDRPGAAAAADRAQAPAHERMSTREIIRVLRIIRDEAKVPSVSFTGGEPTLREDLEDLVAAARDLGLRTNLITNGMLLGAPGRAERLRAAGLASAQVSLEGPTAQIHDDLTGLRGSFERTLAGLRALRQAGIHTHTNTTINARNVEHMEALVRFVADLGLARMSANMVIPAGTAADRAIQVPYSRIGPIVLKTREAARRYGVEFMWYSPTPMCLFNPLAMGLGNKSCAACDGLLSVSPSGDVLPCSSYPEPVGNLLRQPFAEVWASARARFFRRKDYAPPECHGCRELATCAAACPLYWSAMGTSELAGRRRASHVPA